MNKTPRELKFRVWLHDEKKWGEVAVLEVFNTSGQLEYLYQNQEYTIQQYTGLKDKNGKEIYEGDIINTKVNRYVIEYSAPKVGFTARGLFYSKAIINPNDLESGFILGNIFENPELLK